MPFYVCVLVNQEPGMIIKGVFVTRDFSVYVKKREVHHVSLHLEYWKMNNMIVRNTVHIYLLTLFVQGSFSP